MRALIFTGALEREESSTSARLSNYLKTQLESKGIETDIFKIADSGVPLFDVSLIDRPPIGVQRMNLLFRNADFHIWMTPLYHGSMTGVMKNCLDWLEINSDEPIPYLTGKVVGLICWADGVQAIQGINAMDSVVKALRAWVAPYSIAILRKELFNEQNEISDDYKIRFNKLIQLLKWNMK